MRNFCDAVMGALPAWVRRPSILLTGIALLVLFVACAVILPGEWNSALKSNRPAPHFEHKNTLLGQLEFGAAWAAKEQLPEIEQLKLGAVAGSKDGAGYLNFSGSEGQSKLMLDSPELAEFFALFPNVTSVTSCFGQLRTIGAEALSKSFRLTNVRLEQMDLDQATLEELAGIHSLESLEVFAARCSGDVRVLRGLRNLKTIRLRPNRAHQSEKHRSLADVAVLQELAALPHLEELILETDFHGPWMSGSLISRTVDSPPLQPRAERMVAALQEFPALRKVYVGHQQTVESREFLETMRSGLPGISVRPMAFAQDLYGFFMGAVVVLMSASWLFGAHLMHMCAVPLSVHANTMRTSNVFLASAANLALVTGAAIVFARVKYPAFHALSLFLPAVALATMMVANGSRCKAYNASWMIIFLFIFAPKAQPLVSARLEGFLLGGNPALSVGLFAISLAGLIYCLGLISWTARDHSEAGFAPSTRMFELAQTISEDARTKVEADDTLDEDWSLRLRSLSPRSPLFRVRLWLLGLTGYRISTMVVRALMFLGLIAGMQYGFQYWLRDDIFRDDTAIMMPVIQGLAMVVLVMAGSSMARFDMFAAELMRPMRRREWIQTSFRSIGALVLITGVSALGVYSLLLLVAGYAWPIEHLFLVLLAIIPFILLTTSLVAYITVKRRWFHAVFVCIGLLATAVVFVVALTQNPSHTDRPPLSAGIWAAILCTECLLAVGMWKLAVGTWQTADIDPR